MNKKSSIDLGLAVLCAIHPCSALSRSDIADVCECSEQRIREIEEKALRKLRHPSRIRRLLELRKEE